MQIILQIFGNCNKIAVIILKKKITYDIMSNV